MFGGDYFDDIRGGNNTLGGVDTGDGQGGGGVCDATVEVKINC